MDRVHHAYLLVGDRGEAEDFLHSFWKERDVVLKGSPDYFVFKEELLGIDEARKLSLQASRKAFTDKKIFFIAPERITQEAQNALLKTFEDPYEDTHFFLYIREEELVLPTLRSRVRIVAVGQEFGKEDAARKFLSSTPASRLSFAKKFAESEKSLSAFLDDLLVEMRSSRSDSHKLKTIYEVRRYSDDRSVSKRLILEHLALSL